MSSLIYMYASLEEHMIETLNMCMYIGKEMNVSLSYGQHSRFIPKMSPSNITRPGQVFLHFG